MLREAVRIVNEHWTLVLLYLAINVPVVAAWLIVNVTVLAEDQTALDERTVGFIQLGCSVFTAIVFSLAATIVFSRLASRIDAPLRKFPGDWAAIERFFTTWLLMTISVSGIIHLSRMQMNAGHLTTAEVMQVVAIVGAILIVPLGAAITFAGNAHWSDVKYAAAGLGRVFDRFLVAAFLGFIQFGFLGELTRDDRLPVAARVVAVAVDGYVDCIIFAYMFLALCDQRDAEDEDDSFGDF